MGRGKLQNSISHDSHVTLQKNSTPTSQRNSRRCFTDVGPIGKDKMSSQINYYFSINLK